jgi:predicted GNAT family N-acyltransferase
VPYEIIRVPVDGPEELLHRIFRLRYEIYVAEKQLDLPSTRGLLRDSYDDYSTNFLLIYGDTDVGTVRYTALHNGPLELMSQNNHWDDDVNRIVKSEQVRVCEATRYMVRREYRGKGVAPRLLYATMRQSELDDVDIVFFAGKLGGLSRLYRSYGAEVCDPTSYPYFVAGCNFGDYQLMKNDRRTRSGFFMARVLREVIPIRDCPRDAVPE